MYSRYIDFARHFQTARFVCHSIFSNISNVFFDSFKVIHHCHITQEIYSYAHKFCNKKVRELTAKGWQYFSCVFHNGFRYDMTFLTKEICLSLWQMQDVSPLSSGLSTLKSYSPGLHVKFIDAVKYYQ